MSQLPTKHNSPNANLLSVFRIIWNINMLLKNVLKINVACSEGRHDCKRYVHMHSTTLIVDLYKTIWKLNMLVKNMLNIKYAVNETIHDCQGCDHIHSTLTDLYKTIWKFKYL